MIHSVLVERFAMVGLLEKANLEIKESKAINDALLQAYKEINHSFVRFASELSQLKPIIEESQRRFNREPEVLRQFEVLSEWSFSLTKIIE